MAYALYAQHILGLEPCPLCVLQRMALISVGCLFLAATIYNPTRLFGGIYAALIAVAALAGIGVAARHLWLQNLPPDQVPACGPGLDFMLDAFPLTDVLSMVLSGSGECAEVDWSFLGLSMPGWVLLALTALGAWGAWSNLRRAA
jgi:disulfide bond formation protein DsbB